MEKSGVVFPWANWSRNSSTVGLENYAGKQIKIGFIYDLTDPANGNLVRIPEVSVIPHVPVEGPVVGGSTACNFTDAYPGIEEKSGELYLVNEGIGELRITHVEGIAGTGFSTDLVVGEVVLGPQERYTYHVYYTPSAPGDVQATMVVTTNGGDLAVQLTGSALLLSEGYSVEGFESNDYPPIGWAITPERSWTVSDNPRSGKKALEAFWVEKAQLTSPRLALADGDYFTTFDYAVIFGEEELYLPENSFYLEFSMDGGASWESVWTAPTPVALPYTRITVSLGSPASENCLLRWVYRIDGEVNYDVTCSTICLDNVVLPPLYGAGGRPFPVTDPQPADGSTGQSATNLTLSWRGSLFAGYYKLYVGKDPKNPVSVVDGMVLPGEVPHEYLLTGLEYETTYYWKVVAVNEVGESEEHGIWSFTTMKDESIAVFPYQYGFEDGLMPPLGWEMYGENNCRWTNIRNIYPYDGAYSAIATTYGSAGSAVLQLPEIRVPEDSDLQISFVWGNGVSANLSGEGENIYYNNGNDSVWLEVLVPGEEWKKLAICSQAVDNKVWVKEKVLLTGYRGKVISLRWHYASNNAVGAKGASLDNIEIDYLKNEEVAPSIEEYLDISRNYRFPDSRAFPMTGCFIEEETDYTG